MDENDLNNLVFGLSADEARALALPEVRSKLLKSEIFRHAQVILNHIHRTIDDESKGSKHWINYETTMMPQDFRGLTITDEEFTKAVRCILDSIQVILQGTKAIFEVDNAVTSPSTNARGDITYYQIHMLISWVPRDHTNPYVQK